MRKRFLMTPGPTDIPPDVLLEAAQPSMHHRTPQFSKILVEASKGLREIFQTKGDVLTLFSSGTGGMEAAVANLVLPGEKVLVASIGNFGERWGKIVAAFGGTVEKLYYPWGEAVKPDAVEKKLKANPGIKLVFTQHNETSTGVVNDVATLAKVAHKNGALLIVDAISSMGVIPYYTDAWDVDVTISGSQKGFMIPPGLAFIHLGKRAWDRVAKKKQAGNKGYFYFDLAAARDKLNDEKSPTSPWTPAVSLVRQLKVAVDMVLDEGMQELWARHHRLAEATRAAVRALKLKPFAKANPSDAITSVKVPAGVDGAALVKKFRDEWGVTIAGGQGDLKGKIFRIGHMGYAEEKDIIQAIGVLELILKELGHKFALGAGVTAALKSFAKK